MDRSPPPPHPCSNAAASSADASPRESGIGGGGNFDEPCACCHDGRRRRRRRGGGGQRGRRPLHVEVLVRPSSSAPLAVLEEEARRLLATSSATGAPYRAGPVDLAGASPLLARSAERVSVVDLDDDEDFDLDADVVDFCHRCRGRFADGGDGGDSSSPGGTTAESTVAFWQVSEVVVRAFVLNEEEAEMESIEMDEDGSGGEEQLNACESLVLPHASLHGLWDSLVMERGLKRGLLEYARSALLFSDRGVSEHVVSWNRVILLHGPPGTGKTSLCRALAHKLAIRMGGRFRHAQLLEVHSHSLFSKWFSESGKLVARLFRHVQDLVDDPDTLVCVLIDEVESLAAARSGGGGGGEPSDAMRVVNSMLTCIDRLKRFPNVVVLTTTNVTGAVDLAFVDRADIKRYVGLPCVEARYEILRGCVDELVRVGIVASPPPPPGDGGGAGAVVPGEEAASTGGSGAGDGGLCPALLLPYHQAVMRARRRGDGGATQNGGNGSNPGSHSADGDVEMNGGGCHVPVVGASSSSDSLPLMASDHSPSLQLLRCAEMAEGLSGRSLRKLPFQSHALFVRSDTVPLREFLTALAMGVARELDAREKLESEGSKRP